ncbi:MAG TPA: hypothetical protein VFH54_07740 [Mycobacteriales bacterium]|nr:hypothetical protein [Mycobacteriales bacterium]
MTSTVEAIHAAGAAVDRALQHSVIRVAELTTPTQAHEAAELLRTVWHDDNYPVPANLLVTIQHAGGYLHGAYDATHGLVGVSLGILSNDGLHSHITGVVEPARRRGLGYALKQHQRLWALDHGLTCITWTCDPLVRRNVAFNLHALGADIVDYAVDHYGAMTDGVNHGDESDRFVFHWRLLSDAAVRAGRERLPFLRPAGRPPALVAADHGPEPTGTASIARLVATPADIELLRVSNPEQAMAWRHAMREAVHPALVAGGRIAGLTANGDIVVDCPRS